MNASMREGIENGQSVFTGSTLGYWGIQFAVRFLSVITLGLAYPWLLCWEESWYASHTYINGRQLCFDGTGGQWFGRWLLYLLLTVITLGIYGLWVPVQVMRWKVKHTHFLNAAVPVGDSRGPGETGRCRACGASVDDASSFCTVCGAPVGSKTPAPEPPIPKPEFLTPLPGTPSPGFGPPDDSDL